jgi:hypothetical protein
MPTGGSTMVNFEPFIFRRPDFDPINRIFSLAIAGTNEERKSTALLPIQPFAP